MLQSINMGWISAIATGKKDWPGLNCLEKLINNRGLRG
jgi:hypothetical protein